MSKRSDFVYQHTQLATKLCYECEKSKRCRLRPKSECEILHEKLKAALGVKEKDALKELQEVAAEKIQKQSGMSVEHFWKLCKQNHIPGNAIMMSDSGWECGESDCEAMFYNPKRNVVMLVQGGNCEAYSKQDGWVEIMDNGNEVDDIVFDPLYWV